MWFELSQLEKQGVWVLSVGEPNSHSYQSFLLKKSDMEYLANLLKQEGF
jgi:hypothetical protein